HARLGGVLLHRIDGPDPGLDLHDHPWPFVSIVLRGGYTEEACDTRHAVECAGLRGVAYRIMVEGRHEATHEPPVPLHSVRTWRRWSVHRMPLDVAHRITDAEPGTVTLVLRRPKVREWGFYTPAGWAQWDAYDYAARRPVGVRSN